MLVVEAPTSEPADRSPGSPPGPQAFVSGYDIITSGVNWAHASNETAPRHRVRPPARLPCPATRVPVLERRAGGERRPHPHPTPVVVGDKGPSGRTRAVRRRGLRLSAHTPPQRGTADRPCGTPRPGHTCASRFRRPPRRTAEAHRARGREARPAHDGPPRRATRGGPAPRERDGGAGQRGPACGAVVDATSVRSRRAVTTSNISTALR